jgi:hypothetical protein
MGTRFPYGTFIVNCTGCFLLGIRHGHPHREDASQSKLALLLHKADRVSRSEVAAATEFASRILQRDLSGSIGPIYEVSALGELEGRSGRDWNAFVTALQ